MTASVADLPVSPSRRTPDIAIAPRTRVLFINDTARNGGPGRSLHALLTFLDPAAVHRAVVVPRAGAIAELLSRDRVADELHFEPNLVENPIEPWGRPMERADFDAPAALKAARLAGNALKATRAVARLAALVRRGRFDLIYCNGTNADFAGAALARLTGVPALWHVRYSSVPRVVAPLHARLAASAGVRRIVCVSRAAAGLFPHCAGKVAVVNNAIDVASFDPASVVPSLRRELGLAEGAVVFGAHGRILRRKGIVELVHAAKRAVDRLGADARGRIAFVVVGDTPQDFRDDHVAACRALASEFGLGGVFHMLGFRMDVRPLVADFDVAVVPSVYADPLPRSVLEAMALGRPVIAFDVGGVGEMIDGAAGHLVRFEAGPDGTGASDAAIDRLADAIVRYARDPALRASQGAAAYERVRRDFDGRAHARRVHAQILAAVAVP